ncbi:hypothetical protein PVOR_15364 [Paenibacillus vortex V453]|uniref:Uncharacterized protein n=1 Tax=Paenibacillus vortex V453 TaxID=715225 RepID=A0A2R9SUI2_9BACL|nr:hypothetical protein PVOR_15364 [Paenibacillus vortex V453]
MEIGKVLYHSQIPDNLSILDALRSFWTHIQKFMKKIYPEWMIYFLERLTSIDPNELVITFNMMMMQKGFMLYCKRKQILSLS